MTNSNGIIIREKHRSGLAVATENGKYFHVGINLRPAYENRFDHVTNFRNGFAIATLGNRKFHINKEGKRVYFATYQDLTSVKKGDGTVKYYAYGTPYIGDQTVYIDMTNPSYTINKLPAIIHTRTEYAEVLDPELVGGLRRVKTYSGKIIHVDKNWNPIHKVRFDWVGNYRNGYAAARLYGKMFHIDKHGRCPYEERFVSVELPNNIGIGRAYDEYDNEYIINFMSDAIPIPTGKVVPKSEREAKKKAYKK